MSGVHKVTEDGTRVYRTTDGETITDVSRPAPPVLVSSTVPFADGVKMHPYGGLIMTLVGMDGNGRLWARDATNGNLSQSDDWGANWSNLRGIPSGTAHASLVKVVPFAGYIWAVLQESASGDYKVYRAADVVRTTALSWSSALFTMPAGTHINVRSALNAGTDYLYLGTYTGAGTDDSRIYRLSTADAEGAGTNWQVCYGPTTGVHHVHAVAEDPYNAGHIYATLGDNSSPACVVRSTDGGDTWAEIIDGSPDNPWQSVQISFSPNWVWMAADRHGLDITVFDRDDLTPYSAATNHHWNIAVPNPSALGDRFYKIGYWGAVDPDTESFLLVANDTSTSGNTQGVFILPHVGGRIELVESKPAGGIGEVFVGDGLFWTGQWKYAPQSTVG